MQANETKASELIHKNADIWIKYTYNSKLVASIGVTICNFVN